MDSSILTHNMVVLAKIITSVAIMIGVFLFVGGVFQLKKYGEMRSMMSQQMTIAAPLAMIIAGSALLILPSFAGAMLIAFWGTASPLSIVSNISFSAYMKPVIVFVRVIGLGTMVRGIFLFSRSGSGHAQPGTMGKAAIHVIAGVLCMHIIGTLELLAYILGISWI